MAQFDWVPTSLHLHLARSAVSLAPSTIDKTCLPSVRLLEILCLPDCAQTLWRLTQTDLPSALGGGSKASAEFYTTHV